MSGVSMWNLHEGLNAMLGQFAERQRRAKPVDSIFESDLENARDAERLLYLVRRLRQETAVC